MIDQHQTFCTKPKPIHLCNTCERRLWHPINDSFVNMNVKIGEYEPETTNAHVHCDGWIVYPMKDKEQ